MAARELVGSPVESGRQTLVMIKAPGKSVLVYHSFSGMAFSTACNVKNNMPRERRPTLDMEFGAGISRRLVLGARRGTWRRPMIDDGNSSNSADC